jgi:hypothetical protein
MYRSRYGGGQVPGLETESLIRVVEACTTGCANNGGIAGLNYRSLNWFSNVNWNNQWSTVASLVTGRHSIKFGYQGALLIDQRKNFSNDQFVQYRTQNGIPDQITLNINRFQIYQSVRSDAFYAQEQWTAGALHAAGCAPLRPCVELLPGADRGCRRRFFPTATTYPAHDRRRGVSRSVAARRLAHRRVRHGQDVGQAELRTLPRGGAERRDLHRVEPDRPPVHHHHPRVDR